MPAQDTPSRSGVWKPGGAYTLSLNSESKAVRGLSIRCITEGRQERSGWGVGSEFVQAEKHG
jgi:hypothetical protein